MSSKYIVPSQRNQLVQQQVNTTNEYQFKEEDFPPLSTAQKVTVFANKPGITFANLAKQWSDVHMEQMVINELKQKQEEELEKIRVTSRVQLPKFKNFHRFIDTQETNENNVIIEREEEEQPVVQNNEEDEGWIEVKPKKRNRRKAKPSIEELANRPPTPEEEPNEETVWNENDYSDWNN